MKQKRNVIRLISQKISEERKDGCDIKRDIWRRTIKHVEFLRPMWARVSSAEDRTEGAVERKNGERWDENAAEKKEREEWVWLGEEKRIGEEAA